MPLVLASLSLDVCVPPTGSNIHFAEPLLAAGVVDEVEGVYAKVIDLPEAGGHGLAGEILALEQYLGVGIGEDFCLVRVRLLCLRVGASDSKRLSYCSGAAAPKIGSEILHIFQISPPGRSNCSAVLRWLFAWSGAFGLPPPIENRTSTRTGLPLNADANGRARPYALPMNSPVAHTPLAPDRRNRSALPPARSKARAVRKRAGAQGGCSLESP